MAGSRFKQIPLDESGHVAIVSPEDFKKVADLKWYLSDTGYAVWRGIKYGAKKTIRMHRVIANAPNGMVVDHLNGNKLDNRKTNLRVCTQAENTRNRKGTKGYTWDKSKGKWLVRHGYKFYGRYATEAEAQRAYQLACSGVPYTKTRRKYWNLPKGVTKQFGKYRVCPQKDGVKHWLGAYSTVQEAEAALNEWKNRG